MSRREGVGLAQLQLLNPPLSERHCFVLSHFGMTAHFPGLRPEQILHIQADCVILCKSAHN